MSNNPTATAPAARLASALAGAVAASFLILPGATPAADFGSDIAQAFKDGKFNVAFRYRYEYVEDDNPSLADDTANASTLRSRITYQSAAYNDFSVLFEFDDLRPVGDDDYNSTRNGKTDRPTVADPEATDLNQAYIKYMGLANTELIIGRQKIIRGNERFVGPVGWRQNEQTFDSASINYKFNDKLQAYYAFVDQVNRIFGPESGTPPADLTGQTHLADVSYLFGPAAKLTVYGYFIDLEETPTFSSQTIGARLAGDIAVNDQWAIPYAVEYAVQDDFAGNPNNYDADYYLVDVGARWNKVTVRLAYEVLEGGSTAGQAFQTPLATGHAFQGWADKFLTTPDAGIEDLYLLVDFPLLGANVKIRYDDYQAEASSLDYGNEIGVWATWPVGKYYSIAAKYARFDADRDSTAAGLQDADKFWVMLSANF